MDELGVQKFSQAQAKVIKLSAAKTILKYPSPGSAYDISSMTVTGRYPEAPLFSLNQTVDFFIYVLKGKGQVELTSKCIPVATDDVVFVPARNKYAISGTMTYLTICVPAFEDEQASLVE